MRARGLGAHVIVTEVDPMRALEALMDGYEVLPMERAAEIGDIFCTATGDKHVIMSEHFERMKDGAILANTGHFNVEIDIPGCARSPRRPRGSPVRRGVPPRRRAAAVPARRRPAGEHLAAEGHPAIVMDMSFANQALSVEWALANAGSLERKVYGVPEEIDREIARLKLETMGVEIDELTDEQAHYLASWDEA